jgi:hypothetical protein
LTPPETDFRQLRKRIISREKAGASGLVVDSEALELGIQTLPA